MTTVKEWYDPDNAIQGSPGWFQARLGLVTASRVADVIAKTKSGYSASRENYKAQLVAEQLTGTVADSYSNAAMQWGIEKEPEARLAYEMEKGAEVELVGFIRHPTLAAGASPDGRANGGLVEVKCPATATHISYLLDRKEGVPQKYATQIQWQLCCAGGGWCDWVSYDPRMPHSMQLLVRRVDRDDAYIKMLEEEVAAFIEDLDATVAALREKFGE